MKVTGTILISVSPQGKGVGLHKLMVEQRGNNWVPGVDTLGTCLPLLGVGSSTALRAVPERREIFPPASDRKPQQTATYHFSVIRVQKC